MPNPQLKSIIAYYNHGTDNDGEVTGNACCKNCDLQFAYIAPLLCEIARLECPRCGESDLEVIDSGIVV